MNRVVDVAHPDHSILLELDALADGPDVGGRVARRRCLLGQPLEGLGSARRALLSHPRGLADAPHEITIEGAAQPGADAAVIIARAGAEADARIALKWLREPPPSPAPRCPRTADTGMMRRGVGWRGCPGVE